MTEDKRYTVDEGRLWECIDLCCWEKHSFCFTEFVDVHCGSEGLLYDVKLIPQEDSCSCTVEFYSHDTSDVLTSVSLDDVGQAEEGSDEYIINVYKQILGIIEEYVNIEDCN